MPLMHGKSEKAFTHNVRAEMEAGKPQKQSLAIAYAMKKKKKMADGGEITPQPTSTATIDPKKAADVTASMRKAFGYAEGGMTDDDDNGMEMLEPEKPASVSGGYASGGFVGKEEASGYGDEIVDRIMRKCYSKGGMVANDTPPIADSEEADYDDLALRDDLESSYTGANSGDELGDAQEDEDRHDIVSRIMKSRAKKDRMPRPA